MLGVGISVTHLLLLEEGVERNRFKCICFAISHNRIVDICRHLKGFMDQNFIFYVIEWRSLASDDSDFVFRVLLECLHPLVREVKAEDVVHHQSCSIDEHRIFLVSLPITHIFSSKINQ